MDADFRVVDLDIVDHRTQIGATEGRVAGQHVLTHNLDEGRYLLLGDTRLRAHLGDCPVESRLRNVTFRLDSGNPIFKGRVCWIGDAVLDGLIEPAKAGFCV